MSQQSNARQYWRRVEQLSDLERYCELARAEMRAQLIPIRFSWFMTYYESTPYYRQHREHIEQCRMAEIDRCLREGKPKWSD